MTARSDNLVKAPVIGTIAILVASLTLLVATGPAIAATDSSRNPSADARLADAC